MPLDPTPWDRLRTLLTRLPCTRPPALRRLAAALCTLLALALLLRPGSPGPRTAPVLLAAKDLPPGTQLSPADLRQSQHPADTVPDGALADPAAATGRLLARAARRGEPLTDLSLTGPRLTALTAGKDATAVPVRLSDPALAELLTPGAQVDVFSADPPEQLAEAATVLTVLGPRAEAGESHRMVLIAVPRQDAARVATSSLTRSVAITLR
ncbi:MULTISPECIES: SAF domain-containing protein [unclassified Crossiella]|uniref:SAF domain-containing protein n=1 Tax=unclassified Crossiella TaxID=2620835 RepID=UPI001FFFCA1A|nr:MULTISPECIES: SAF domain-containing protein [unclassified Crossiella]MCK2238126.1 SAF domain-containing protein [Crossiella sp. S99.2]MCK2256166.1 SAF domain-containing protein [Crossiella sp. S99.1]